MHQTLTNETAGVLPSLLGNGDLLFFLDREGAVPQKTGSSLLPDGGIFRRGHLHADGTPVSYGRIYPQIMKKQILYPEESSLSLDFQEGIFFSTCSYGESLTVRTEACAHVTLPVLAEEPQAARDTARAPAIAAAVILRIFMMLFPSYNLQIVVYRHSSLKRRTAAIIILYASELQ